MKPLISAWFIRYVVLVYLDRDFPFAVVCSTPPPLVECCFRVVLRQTSYFSLPEQVDIRL